MKSGGHLIALEYPIRPDDKTGPPWPVSPQIYADLLIPLGEPLPSVSLNIGHAFKQPTVYLDIVPRLDACNAFGMQKS